MNKRVMFLEGRHIYLRPVQPSDLPYFVQWFNDQEVTHFLGNQFPMTEMQEKAWIEGLTKRSGSDIVLVIVIKGKTPKSDRPIGTMGLHNIDLHDGVATSGAAIGAKDTWGKGYGSEAKMLLLDYAFNRLNLRKVYSRVLAFNGRSRAYSEKCGYVLEATHVGRHVRDGQLVDELVLVVNAEEWRELWEKTKKKFLPKKKK